MTATVKNLAETVEQLPANERIYLAERLLARLEEADHRAIGLRIWQNSVATLPENSSIPVPLNRRTHLTS